MDAGPFPFQATIDGGSAAGAVASEVWGDEDARFYADGLALSDYAVRVGSELKALLGNPASLLDVGAGTGVLGRALVAPGGRWTAVEPNGFLADTLESHAVRPADRVIRDRWQNLSGYRELAHDVVLAANMGGPLDEASHFVSAMLPLARTALCWTVPAQNGPRRYCLSGFLPVDLHGEDTTPGIAIAIRRLGEANMPHRIRYVDWTFRARFENPSAAEDYFVARFAGGDSRRLHTIREHIRTHLEREAGAYFATASKTTAILIWDTTREGTRHEEHYSA